MMNVYLSKRYIYKKRILSNTSQLLSTDDILWSAFFQPIATISVNNIYLIKKKAFKNCYVFYHKVNKTGSIKKNTRCSHYYNENLRCKE